MLCTECGQETNLAIEDRPSYDFPDLTIVNAHVYRCPDCGNEMDAVPALREKTKVIVGLILDKPGRLTAAEINYLRKFMRWTGQEMANLLGVRVEAISRWENGHSLMSTSADKLLRLVVAPAVDIDRSAMQARLPFVAVGESEPLNGAIEFVDRRWTRVSDGRQDRAA